MGISQDSGEHGKYWPIPPIHCHENAWKLNIWPVSLSQNSAKMRKIIRLWPKCNLFWRWSEYTNMPNLRPFIQCILKKPRLWPVSPVSQSQNGAKMRKTNRSWPKCYQLQKWSGYISMSNVRAFLSCVLNKILETPNLTCFTKSKWHKNVEYQQTVSKI